MTVTFLTKEGCQKLQDELDHLRTVKRQEVADRLHEAMEGGELIENAEYEAAKNEQAFVEGRIQELDMILATARIIEENGKSKEGLIQVGSTITMEEEGNKAETFIIVGAAEAMYEAVILDISEDLRTKLVEVQSAIGGLPLMRRMEMAIDMMTEYLFDHPEISNLVLFRYFGKTRDGSILNLTVPEVVSDIARSMGLCKDKKNVPPEVKMKVLAVMNSIHNFVSGEDFFRSMIGADRENYISMVKETLKFVLIPAFAE